jgi:hypothetical protein
MNASNTPAAARPPGSRFRFMPLHEAIGRGLRHAREEVGVTQDTVARRARHLGLSWDRAKVAALERGEKPLSVEELLVLLMVAHDLGIADGIDRLLGGLERDLFVEFGGRAGVSATSVGEIMASGRAIASIGNSTTFSNRPSGTRGSYAAREDKAISRAVNLGFRNVSYEAWRKAQGEAGETEAKIARRFGETVLVILAACVALWGHSLTYRRDEEIAQLVEEAERRGEPLAARQVQALRGHVTRRLVGELEELFVTDEERVAEQVVKTAKFNLSRLENARADMPENEEDTSTMALEKQIAAATANLAAAEADLAAARASRGRTLF